MINPMRILVRLVLNRKFLEIISRFCATLSAIGCTSVWAMSHIFRCDFVDRWVWSVWQLWQLSHISLTDESYQFDRWVIYSNVTLLTDESYLFDRWVISVWQMSHINLTDESYQFDRWVVYSSDSVDRWVIYSNVTVRWTMSHIFQCKNVSRTFV